MTGIPQETIIEARDALRQRLLCQRNEHGFWEGRLSSSALSTATGVTALAAMNPNTHRGAIDGGIRWLAAHVNSDGGWGDTDRSPSNLSTTTLVWAAFAAARADEQFPTITRGCEQWLEAHLGKAPSPEHVASAIIASYGKDKTFSVPILTMCAISGRFGEGKAAWKHVIPLPFEMAALPHQLYKAVNLPVVSYALPALIAIGQAHYTCTGSRNPLRRWAYPRCLEKLTALQPANGGFLEAAPLTSFVLMSLVAAGQQGHVVAGKAETFLAGNQREDGSWPIDTNLATWVTTLATNALPADAADPQTLTWLLEQQLKTEHPYTHAAPGGWAWTDLPGGVPDADDTPGALLALHRLAPDNPEVIAAAHAGIQWLLDLQNRDGGFPTFCRGWGSLPFDKSCCDLTGHVLRAMHTWQPQLNLQLKRRTEQASKRAIRFLLREQRQNGSWIPLWFGNEGAAGKLNPTLGTSRVLKALAHYAVDASVMDRGRQWLLEHQHPSGGWGADNTVPPSLEETALAVEVLPASEARDRGIQYLIDHLDDPATPIGLYFAQLWYYEAMYPLTFTLAALEAVTAP